MEKRSYSVDKSERVEVSEEEIKPKAPDTVKLVLLRNMKLNYTGPVTGNSYIFDGGGSVLEVDAKDAQIMLAKHGGKCCPGGSGPSPYFAEEG